jgi:hypothetical protein
MRSSGLMTAAYIYIHTQHIYIHNSMYVYYIAIYTEIYMTALSAPIYIYIYACMYVYTYVYVYTYTYIYILYYI